jgi:hypothetical protein
LEGRKTDHRGFTFSRINTTEDGYKELCKAEGVEPNTVEYGENAPGHWIGDSEAENVLIWYHGMLLLILLVVTLPFC